MVKQNLFVAAASLMLSAVSAQAALVINVPNVQLQPNQAGQIVTLNVTGGDSVTGFKLNAQIGNNGVATSTPVFGAADFSVGVWVGKLDTVTGGPVGGAERYMQSSVVLNTSGDTVNASGQLVNLTISTIGINSGSFPLKLAGTDIGQDSVFIGTGGVNIPATITNGSITVAVPEPASLSVLGLGGLLLARRRKPIAA